MYLGAARYLMAVMHSPYSIAIALLWTVMGSYSANLTVTLTNCGISGITV